ncbi:hypothetical protein [uncultured Desulfosarcina sp.]|uniref:hypothetical protein n=1 Tax=uncultured Desulfosarcina sp. TaxID=218289 RepID=UPI0029C6BE91|nr:hypothetical protein [uncultured Desulfosarcina sp.]
MTISERACQIWSILAWVAKNRQSLTFDLLSKLIGVPTAGLEHLLEPINAFCILNNLPLLTVLVVQTDSGLPDSKLTGTKASDIAKNQADVFNYNWLDYGNPQPKGFEGVIKIDLPDNLKGRNIREKIIPTVCNLNNMLDKLKSAKGNTSLLKPWEKISYKAYRIDEIQKKLFNSKMRFSMMLQLSQNTRTAGPDPKESPARLSGASLALAERCA